MLEAENISFAYKRPRLEVLKNLSLSISGGEFCAILGTNGAGKSTLLNILSGYFKPDSGRVLADGADINGVSARVLAKTRAVLEQENSLVFDYSVLDTVLLGRYAHSPQFSYSAQDEEVAFECLRLAGLEGFEERFYTALSGGEKRRVQLARTLAQIYSKNGDYSGKTLLLDEPCSGLDPAHAAAAMKLAKNLAQNGAAVAAVLHDPNLAAMYADKIAVMGGHTMLACGSPQEIMTAEILTKAYGAQARVFDTPVGTKFAVFGA